jgi:tryptophanyl-tRNA synthetase
VTDTGDIVEAEDMTRHGNLMAGCRVSAGGLHLGHYLGCILPLANFPESTQYFFVLRDRPNPGLWRSSAPGSAEILAILADLMATPFGDRIQPVLQSDLYPYYRRLVDYFQAILTVNQLININPYKRALRQGASNMSVGDLMFPIESACTYFVLFAERVLMNDDNERFIKFANHLRKKMCSAVGFELETLAAPRLCHGPLPRIHGFDYRKMSKGNRNCIFLSDSDDVLDAKLSQLMRFKHLFHHKPEFGSQYAMSRDQFRLPDEYLPFEYLRAFSSELVCAEIRERLRTIDSQERLFQLLRRVITEDLVHPIRQRSAYLRAHDEVVWARLKAGTNRATEIAERVESAISAQLLN